LKQTQGHPFSICSLQHQMENNIHG